MIFVTFVAIVFVTFVAVPVYAQLPTPAVAGDKPAFEVASIKRRGIEGPVSLMPYPNRAEAINYTLESLILAAYGIQLYQLVDAPEWIKTERFDIIGKAESEFRPREGLLMFRTLMADRFKLKMHVETRQLPMYALVLARKDGTLGPRLRVSPENAKCAANAAPVQRGEKVSDSDRAACAGDRKISAGSMVGTNQTIFDLAKNRLPYVVGRNVIDKTGLTGWFNYALSFAPGFSRVGPDAPDPVDGPSIFTALKDQLGLKLEPITSPAEVLVIDSVERPTEN